VLLTISTTHVPATDLGFLLHKHPDRARSVELAFGTAHVVFPEATDERCTAALLVEVDPVGLVRGRGGKTGKGRGGPEAPSLAGYVNDRPYAASSFLSVALGQVFRTTLNGRLDSRPELAATPLPLEVEIPTVPCRGGEPLLRSLFEPLGYEVEARALPLDETVPEWGVSRYLAVRLRGTAVLADLLAHLYVLLPVLDDEKHHWVGEAEAEKLLARGGTWLAEHPAKELITQRYLRHRRGLVQGVLTQLAEDASAEPGTDDEDKDAEEAAVEAPLSLNQQRLAAVVAVLRDAGAARIVDLGCGEGRLVQALLAEPWVGHVTGVDVSPRVLEHAARRLHLDRMTERQRARVDLVQGGLTYRDRRFADVDAACLVEVIEHVDEGRLGALEQVVFAHARPPLVVVTTPNVEHNVRFATLATGTLRHRDHRFEWTRAELAAWAETVAAAHGYTVTYQGIGPDDPEVGPPTQMAVFTSPARRSRVGQEA
jgi:3' terminal RNA ribose 2'-O-methyltransferase Hen1